VALLILAAGYFVGRWAGRLTDSMLAKLGLDETLRLLLVRMLRLLVLGLFLFLAVFLIMFLWRRIALSRIDRMAAAVDGSRCGTFRMILKDGVLRGSSWTDSATGS